MIIHSLSSALTPTKPISAKVVGCLPGFGVPAPWSPVAPEETVLDSELGSAGTGPRSPKFNLGRGFLPGLGGLPAPAPPPSRPEALLAILVDESLCSWPLRNLRPGLGALPLGGAVEGVYRLGLDVLLGPGGEEDAVSLRVYRFNCGSGGLAPVEGRGGGAGGDD